MDEAVKKDQDAIRRFSWEIASISAHLEELAPFLGQGRWESPGRNG